MKKCQERKCMRVNERKVCRIEKVEAKNQPWLSEEEQGTLYSKVPVRGERSGREEKRAEGEAGGRLTLRRRRRPPEHH